MKKNLLTILLILISTLGSIAQVADSTNFSFYYSSPKEYTIGGIEIVGIKYLDKEILKGYSRLQVGDEITVPGDKITSAIKQYWKQGLFSDVRINASKIDGDIIYLEIFLQERPRLSKVNYFGVKKSEIDDIEEIVNFIENTQIVDSYVNNAERLITDIFHEKGFFNTEVNIVQKDDPKKNNAVILDVNIDKKEKVKIDEIIFHGVEEIPEVKLEWAMKKTKGKKAYNMFFSKKFQEDKFEEDKLNLIDKYNQLGFRDAIVVADSMTEVKENRVRLDIYIEEGNKYHVRDIRWVGNTIYPAEYLNAILGIEKGDIYNEKQLNKRLNEDTDAVSTLYTDNGYLFYRLIPVEANIESDSIDLEMRISEGTQAKINRVIIEGNTKTHEKVARRELYTMPGDLFSVTNVKRSAQRLGQLGHFDPEQMDIQPLPNQGDGTVDIKYGLIEKGNDQVELSGGWGMGMFVGSLGLRFTNFSVNNFFDPDAWEPLPTGDGQTLSIKAQTNGKYYQQYSLSFSEPWLGGKKPNNFSVSVYYSKITQANSAYNYNSSYGTPYTYGDGTTGVNNGTSSATGEVESYQITSGATLGYGFRLPWPDDYFTLYIEAAYQHYNLKDWSYYFLESGNINDISLKLALSRSSVSNPLYPRNGSSFSLSVETTPPYSLFSDREFSEPELKDEYRYRYIEYHKWAFKGEWFKSLDKAEKLVLRTKYEFGYLGYYNKFRRTPLEGYKVGGDGMSGYDMYGTETIGLRGYGNNSLTPSTGANIYNKATVELRYPITLSQSANIYALTFFEAGNAWYDYKTFNPFVMKKSVGVGVRFWLPMFGLLGVDWGYGLDDIDPYSTYDDSSSGSQFHFIIGQQF